MLAPGPEIQPAARRRPSLGAAVLSGTLVVALAATARAVPLPLDDALTAAIAPLGQGPLAGVLDISNAVGSLVPWLVLLAVAAAASVLAGRRGELVLAAGIGAEVLTLLIKLAVARPRPDTAAPLELAMDQSFPSGHVVRVTVVVGSVLLVFRPTGWKRVAAHLLVLLAAATAGAARIAAGAHFPSDVLGGALLAAFVLSVLALAIEADARAGGTAVPARAITAIDLTARQLQVLLLVAVLVVWAALSFLGAHIDQAGP